MRILGIALILGGGCLFGGQLLGGMIGEHPDPVNGGMAAANTSPGYWIWQLVALIPVALGAILIGLDNKIDPDRPDDP